jgi:hypothetical protein
VAQELLDCPVEPGNDSEFVGGIATRTARDALYG